MFAPSLRYLRYALLSRPHQSRPALSRLPYVIGLTGGSGSGKTSIARRLEGFGAARIDADQLGHETYRLGTAAYHRIVQEFGAGEDVGGRTVRLNG